MQGPLPDAAPRADLWCTYAAIRTHAWLGRVDVVAEPDRTAAYLRSHRNADGGYAWSRGMPSDAWATFYCTAGLKDLGRIPPDPDRTLRWLGSTWSGDAYAMTADQAPEVWATHFATRCALEVLGGDVPDRDRLLAWLGSLQTRDGGLAWSPAHAAGRADARACFYGVATWRALTAAAPVDPPWDVAALAAWLRSMRRSGGGFGFHADADTPCMWATYRAVGALAALGEAVPDDTAAWVLARRDPAGAFVRWPDYPVADVWASFCAIGTLNALGGPTPEIASTTVDRLAAFALPEGGYTYREPARAHDALTIAATALTGKDTDQAALLDWLAACQMPNEGGVMYMPGRGAELRCTAWALAAGAFAERPAGRDRIAAWLGNLQNPDGGFGYWEGRGSDLVSTAAAVEACALLERPVPDVLDPVALAAFVEGRRAAAVGSAWGPVPGASPTLRSSLQALRVLHSLGRGDAASVAAVLERHRVRGGGWADTGNRMPDLLSTYEAVATADRHGLPVHRAQLEPFLDRTGTPSGAAWSPLAPPGGDPLADCLHRLLRDRLSGERTDLPALTLS